MLVFASGGDDFEVQAPGSLAVNSQYGTSALPFVAQMDTTGDVKLAEKPIGTSKVPFMDVAHSAFCIGEHFTSVKLLLNRYVPFYFNTSLFTLDETVWPWFCGITSDSSAGSNAISTGSLGGDALSYFGPCYAMMRGSSRLLIVPVQPGAPMVATVLNQTITSSTIVSDPSTPPFLTNNSSTVVNYGLGLISEAGAFQDLTNNQAPGEYSILPYAATPSRLLQYQCRATDKVPLDPSQPTSFLAVNCDSNNGFRTYRSFGDDAQLGYFVGCPPVCTTIIPE